MKFWFKAKRYGYGWYPSSWEGWLVLLLHISFNVWNFLRLDIKSNSASDTLRPFIIGAFLSTALLIFICYKKGEKAYWRWGE